MFQISSDIIFGKATIYPEGSLDKKKVKMNLNYNLNSFQKSLEISNPKVHPFLSSLKGFLKDIPSNHLKLFF